MVGVLPEQKQAGKDFYFDFLLVGLIVVVLALLVLAFFNAQQQHYTALYFSPEELPKSAVAGQALSFSFFIENQEGKPIEYSYSIITEGETKVQKTVLVAYSEKKKISETLTFNKASAQKQKVLVQLKKLESSQPYEIFFWVNVS